MAADSFGTPNGDAILLGSNRPCRRSWSITNAVRRRHGPSPSITTVAVTRSAGPTTFAEVAVAATAFPSMSALHAYTAEVRQALGRHAAKIDIAVVVAPASGGQDQYSPAEEGT